VDQFATNRRFLEAEVMLTKRHPERMRQLELGKQIASLKGRTKCYRFPTDVDRLAIAVGINEIQVVPLVGIRGRIVRSANGLVAEINSELPESWRRFVIAHEISHLLVEKELMSTAVTRPKRSKPEYQQVEKLCDFGAREILLPLNALRNEIGEVSPCLELVCKISAEAQCSIEVTAERICEHPPIWDTARFFIWNFHKGRPLAVRTLPEDGIDPEQIALDDDANSIIVRAFKVKGIVKGHQSLSYGGRAPEQFYMEAVATDDDRVISLRLFNKP